MNEYIFYTHEGSTLPPRADTTVENCQLLGTACGKDLQEARHNLEQQHPWIKACGFDIHAAIGRQLLTDETAEALEQSRQEVEYLISLLDTTRLDAFREWQRSSVRKPF